VIFAILIAAVDVQQAVPDDPLEDACYEADYSQQAMNRCAGDAYERADAALNAQWKKVLDTYGDDAEAKKLLLDGQRAWLKYRDSWCEISALDSVGGSIWPLINSGCLASLTRARTQELKVLLEGEQ
jgi:uncharacterized protein YecT (DUF1311 family)